MEKMPYQPHLDSTPLAAAPLARSTSGGWRTGLPVLAGSLVTLRELQMDDAASLFVMLSAEEVSRFISPPPSTVGGFERFIAWTHQQREAGEYVCFAVTPRGSDVAVGLFQVRSVEPGFGTAEWGFAIGVDFWGSGMFVEGAKLVLDFSFDVVGVHRLEARAAVRNGRGNGALRKIGAVQEGVLRRSFLRKGEHLDQTLWSILDDDWRAARAGWGRGPNIIH